MNSLGIAALLLLLQLPLQPGLAQERPVEKASIEGVVLRSGSGEPLGRAQVKLSRVLKEDDEPGKFFFDGGSDPATRGLPTILTENDGKFLLKDLEPGQYRLSAIRNGYSRLDYGKIINLAPGEKLRNVEFRLIPAGNVTGRVRDSAGEPVAGLDVILLKIEYSQTRKSLLQEDNVRTDDRGEYRFYWIPPGRYYVRVSPSEEEVFSQSKNVITDSTIPIAYYPGVLDPSNGTAIEVLPGAELAGIDIVLPKAVGSTIRGRIVDVSTGKPPKGASMSLAPKTQASIQDFSDRVGFRSEYNPATGTFEIRNVVEGSYWLFASASQSFDAPLPASALAEIRTRADVFENMWTPGAADQIPIEMPSHDLNEVVLTLRPGVTIPVRVSLEGTDFTSAKGMDNVRVTLAPSIEGGNYRQSTRLNSEGVARIENVIPGEYHASIELPPSTGLYVKEIFYGRTDARNDKVQITEQTPATITALLSSKGGQITGTLTDALSQPVSGVEVTLIPDDRDRVRLFRSVTTDRDGHFTFKAIPPGGFKVFSWESLESDSYYDKDVLAKYETQGRPVQVQESSKTTVDLKIIPGPKP